MKNILFILFTAALSITFTTTYAQQTSASAVRLKGVVVDSITNEPLIGATVMLDSMHGTVTNEKGEFNLSGLVKNQENTIEFSYMGYQNFIFKYTPIKNNNLLTRYVRMIPSDLNLGDVTVTAKAPIAKQLGDTTQYNAAAVKVNPDATAGDLLAKMPGFTVSDDGSAETQGEAISRVYVDGKAYFKNNPQEALSTLPADIVESIQFFEEKSDESKFTGADDGTRIKTLNIVTKVKKNSVVLGDYSGGYGSDNRYSVRAMTNILSNDNRFTINLGSNNLNQSATGGGRRFFSRGMRSNGGVNTATGASFNYSGEFKKDDNRYTKIGFDYIYNRNFSEASSSSEQNYFPSSTFTDRTYTSRSAQNSVSNSHNFNLELERGFNSKNRLFFRPSGSFSNGGSNSTSNLLNIVDGLLSNSADTRNHSRNNAYNFSGTLQWLHNFDTKNFLTVEGGYSLSDNKSNNLLTGTNSFIRNQELIDSLINQSTHNGSNTNNASLLLRYTRALTDASRLSATYSANYNWDKSDRKTYLLNPETGLYEDISDELSNTFDRGYLTNKAGLGYDYNVKDKISFNVGAEYQNSTINNQQLFPSNKKYDYNFNSAIFRASLRLFISKTKFFTFRINTQSNLPGVDQLQEVVNNDNPLLVSTGNPNLKQSYNSRFHFFYTSNNIEKSTAFNAYGFISNTFNSIVNSSYYLTEDTEINNVWIQQGAQVSTLANINGAWEARLGANYSFPVNFIKSNLTLDLGYTYQRLPSLYNGEKTYTKENEGRFRLSINSNISENLDFTISSNTSLSYANSDNRNSANNTYLEESAGVRCNWFFFRGAFLNVDYQYNYRHNSAGEIEDPSFNLLNASIGVKFLKSRSAEIRLTAYDLLNQVKSYSHTINDNYIQDSRSNVLERYFLVTLGYKLNTMKNAGKGAASGVDPSRYQPMGGPGGSGRPPMGRPMPGGGF